MTVLKKIKKQKQDIRALILMAIICFIFLAICFRLFDLQILKNQYYKALATGQQEIFEKLIPERGSIYVEDKFTNRLYPLASNKKLFLVYAVPKQITSSEDVAKKLEPILEIPAEKILAMISNKDDLYEPIKHKIEEDKMNQIKDLGLSGIYLQAEPERFYPDGKLASHILGFVGYVDDEKKGQYGVEGYYESLLAGKRGYLKAAIDALGRPVSSREKVQEKAIDGASLVLTIDRIIQYNVEKKLEEAVKKFGAEKGQIIVLNPKTGELIALACYPTFDPNKYSEVKDMNVFTNAAIFDLYEPGSVFKPIVMAAALDKGLVSPNTEVEDKGFIKVDKYTIRNFDEKANGIVTMTEVLEKSINVAMVQVAQKLGKEAVYDYINKFGFNELTGIDLAQEAQAEIKSYKLWSDSDLATSSFGQGLAITPMQLVVAMSAIANQGKIMQPHVVKKIIYSDGHEEIIPIKEVRQVVSSSTAITLSAMMVSVVENGFGELAKVPGYKIAGKTGTAQVPNPDKVSYDPNKRIASFIGFAPYEDPKFSILVKFDCPGGNVHGATIAAPVFKEIAQEIFRYYQIPPSE